MIGDFKGEKGHIYSLTGKGFMEIVQLKDGLWKVCKVSTGRGRKHGDYFAERRKCRLFNNMESSG